MDAWFAQHFFNPTFLAGGAAFGLVAAPIIIHLINRLSYRRVRFAAMEFLLQSQERNRRRVLLEQLLLLLLRILIVLAIIALIARLILDPRQMSVFRGAQAHHLVVLDDSGSMYDRWGETSAFEEGLSVVKRLVAEGARRPNTQRFTLLLLSNPEQPLFSQRDVNDGFITELETKIENLKCSHRSLDLVTGLDAAGQFLAEEKAADKHLHLVSDFRDNDWASQKALSSAIKSLDAGGVAVNLVRTVAENHNNLAITGLSGDLQVAVAGVPVRLKVAVTNHGTVVADDVTLTIAQDGQKLPMTIRFDKIEAETEVEREFDVTFNTAQKHAIEVGLPADSLAEDNWRYLAIDVTPVNRILIIDGDLRNDEGQYLADALAADPTTTGNAPQIETVDFLRRRSLDEFQSIYLLNVATLPPDAVDPLEAFVKTGGGLCWFVGDAVQPAAYNDALHRDGEGLFPVKLASTRRDVSDAPATSSEPDLNFRDHAVFRVFEGQENPYIDASRVYTFLPVADDWETDDQTRKDGVQTIATLRNRDPLVFASQFGKGRVVTFLTTCGPTWNNWATFASYVVLQLELQKYVARTDRVLEQTEVGQPIRVSLDPAVYSDVVEVSAPDPTGERLTRLKAAPPMADPGQATPPVPVDADKPIRLDAVFRDTDQPGVYRVKLINQNQVSEERWTAYNFPNSESDLHLATTAEIRQQIGDDVRVEIQESGDFHWIAGKDAGQEVREWLLTALVLILAAEAFLAYRFSYHPERAGAAA